MGRPGLWTVLTLASLCGPASGQTATLAELATLAGGTTTATNVNRLGDIVGSEEFANGDRRAVLWRVDAESAEYVGPLGATRSVANAINDHRVVVGRFQDQLGSTHAFMSSPGNGAVDIHPLVSLGGENSSAVAVNALGQIVGWAEASMRKRHAFLLNPGATHAIDLGTLGGGHSGATGINDNGEIVGAAEGSDFAWHAAIWTCVLSGCTGRDLGSLGGQNSTAHGISNTGHIWGSAEGSDGFTHAFGFQGPTISASSDHGPFGGDGVAFGGNGRGAIVGQVVFDVFSSTPTVLAFVSDQGTVSYLDDMTGDSPVALTNAVAINDEGVIAANGVTDRGLRAFRLRTGRVAQTMSFTTLLDQVYGSQPVTIEAIATSGLPVSFSTEGSCSVNGNLLNLTGAGVCTVTASQPGNERYSPIQQTQQILISQAELVVAANNGVRIFGQSNPPLTVSFQGFVNGDDRQAALRGDPALKTLAEASSLPGEYPITVDAGTLTSANYTFKFVGGVLTVTPTASTPPSGDACNGAYAGIFHGTLRIRSGQLCIFVAGEVDGNIAQEGGTLILRGVSVRGNIAATSPTTVDLTSAIILGNLDIANALTGSVRICKSQIDGNVKAGQGLGVLAVGTTDGGCAGNSIAGNLAITDNGGQVSVYSNSIQRNLACYGNLAINGGSNLARSKQGQCSGF